jgi:hypothetical protein
VPRTTTGTERRSLEYLNPAEQNGLAEDADIDVDELAILHVP